MVETLQNLQHVYAKWDSRNPWQPGDGPRPSASRSSLPQAQGQNVYEATMQKGRQAWKSKYNSVGPPPVRRPKYQSNKDVALPLSSVANSHIGHFKSVPTVLPNVGRRRPFQGRCCTCTPKSRVQLYSDSIRDAGLHNIFNVETKSESKSWFSRTYYVVSFVIQRTCNFHYPDVSMSVLTSPRLLEAIKKSAEEDIGIGLSKPCQKCHSCQTSNGGLCEKMMKKGVRKYEKLARRMMKRMRAWTSNRLIRTTGWVLHKVLGYLLSSVLVHKGEIRMLQEASKKDIPIIYLPTHRSHLDYILITFVLFNFDMAAPHVAAGENLMIPFFGNTLLRGLGGYFIRRKLDKTAKKDYVYRAILSSYMEELLKLNQSFEFFIEGGRTRSGKALYPKGGLLSVVAEAVQDCVIEDTLIVPVSISYDKLIDGNFNREQMGEPKVYESFWRTCVALYSIFMAKYGNVRIDFCQPFSLKEYLKEASNFGSRNVQYLGESCSSGGADSPVSVPDRLKISPSETSLLGGDTGEEQRHLIQGLADHIVFTCVGAQAIMSTQLISFILLVKHRQGVKMSALVEDLDDMREEIMNRGRDMGFTGKSADVVEHARYLLGSGLIKKTTAENGEEACDVIVQPALDIPQIFELSYYSNVVSSVFALESIMAHQICVMAGTDLWSAQSQEKIFLSKEDVIDGTVELCELFKNEYIFNPPCCPLETTLQDTFDLFTTAEVLVRDEGDDDTAYRDSREKEWSHRLAATLSCNTEDDYDDDDVNFPVVMDTMYCLSVENYSLDKLKFLRAVTAPIFETYFIVACNLMSLVQGDKPEDDFCKTVHKALKERVYSGIASYGESAALDTLKNAIRGFQHLRVVECYQIANVKMLTLNKKYHDEQQIQEFVSNLEKFRQ